MKTVRRRAWMKWATANLLLPASFPGCRRPPSGTEAAFDVAIIGGGIAGLTAAVALQSRRVLMLEATARLGGRVETKRRAGVTYEMGALMAYDPRVVPFGHRPSRLIRTVGQIGLSLAGTTRLASTPAQLVNSVASSTDERVGPLLQRAILTRADIEAAFFSVIHPGERAHYIEARRGDWKATLRFDQFEDGNGELVSELARRLRAEVRLESTVVSLKMVADGLEVAYLQGEQNRTCVARAVIIATPAPVAARLLRERAPAWLSNVQYGRGVVVVLALATSALPPFSYVVTPDLSMNCVIANVRGPHRVLTVYFSGKRSELIAGLSKDELVQLVLRDLARGDIGRLDPNQLLFSDVKVWRDLGPVIGATTYGSWSPGRLQPLPRVFLAGDYTCWDSEQFPYGMSAAIKSGQVVGRVANDWLIQHT